MAIYSKIGLKFASHMWILEKELEDCGLLTGVCSTSWHLKFLMMKKEVGGDLATTFLSRVLCTRSDRRGGYDICRLHLLPSRERALRWKRMSKTTYLPINCSRESGSWLCDRIRGTGFQKGRQTDRQPEAKRDDHYPLRGPAALLACLLCLIPALFHILVQFHELSDLKRIGSVFCLERIVNFGSTCEFEIEKRDLHCILGNTWMTLFTCLTPRLLLLKEYFQVYIIILD